MILLANRQRTLFASNLSTSACPGSQCNRKSECDDQVLMGAINHALTAATDHFQQFVIAQLSQYLGNARCFLVLANSNRSILFNISNRAAVRRDRQAYGGRVADG